MIHVKVWWLWENNTSFFVAAYNKPRHSTRSTRAERRPQASLSARGGRTLSPTSPSALWPLPALEWCGVGILGGQYDVPAGCCVATLAPRRVVPVLFDHLLTPTNQALRVLWPRVLHKNSIQFYDALWLPWPRHLFFFFCSFLAADRKATVRLLEGW